jgi:8-oxo-dGTP pyrophosphatase MutT (NUDIX family)
VSESSDALAERLRAALALPPAEPPIEGDHPELRQHANVPAAVLVSITARPDPGVILTVRRDDMRTHAGQVAFPGGRVETGETVVAAALREANEELMLDPRAAAVVGAIEPYRTITGFVVTPVVAVVPPDLVLSAQESEVADWFEAPLSFVLDGTNHHRKSALFAGQERHYYEIVWNGRRIWGATAAMIVNLARRLQWR